ncbi:BQ5605_C003g02075 [Microbotryum silenes-dioicae]|uniref:DNA-directed RNA polymerase subunit n=1 Tax=Microbotryum silenes-dioicae TaxID=796604 RepID=A0A2X0M0R5_9BASI|nr:BQ5605_C003g02075 [Microbotryum silenes-dioicae]
MASISFCGECNNLLYPKEDKVSHVLMYACRNCHYKEETTNPCVYKHDLLVVSKETAGVTQDLQTDPTLVNDLTNHCTAKIKYRMSKMVNAPPPTIGPCLGLKGNTPQDDDPVRINTKTVFFQGQAKRTDTKMTLFFVCTNCHKTFQDPILNRR